MRLEPRTIVWAIALIAGLLGWASQGYAQSCDAPNPNFQVAKPEAGISPSAAAFSGEWDGTWTFEAGRRKERHTDMVCSKLFISVTGSNSANVAYCSGSNPDVGTQASCTNYTAKIDADKLTFGALVFTASGGNSLAAELHRITGSSIETQFHHAG